MFPGWIQANVSGQHQVLFYSLVHGVGWYRLINYQLQPTRLNSNLRLGLYKGLDFSFSRHWLSLKQTLIQRPVEKDVRMYFYLIYWFIELITKQYFLVFPVLHLVPRRAADALMYAKPNVAIFNIDIFIQFNPYSFNLIFIFIQFNRRSFNSIPIVILFNPHSFNSIFRSIQFNFCILLIQFQYWFNLISIFIQFNFYIHSIQSLIHSIQFSYSFNSIRLYSFNLCTHLFNLGVWVEGKNLSGSWDIW